MTTTFQEHVSSWDATQRNACLELLANAAHDFLSATYPSGEGFQLTEIRCSGGVYARYTFDLEGDRLNGRIDFSFEQSSSFIIVNIRPTSWFASQADAEKKLAGELESIFNQYGVFHI